MEAKFSPTVKNIIQYSREEAIANGQDYIGTEHLLLGILHDENNVAVGALKALNVDIQKLHNSMIKAFETMKKVDTSRIGSIPLTKQAEKAIKTTPLEAKLLKSDVISSFHLLLSILRDENALASQILMQFEVNYDVTNRFSSTSEYKKVADLELIESIEVLYTPPLSLIFDTSEYSSQDVKEIISLLSELYHSIGGDHLKIKGMSQFEFLTELDLA